ncbi:hypothetical protein ATCC90586_009472 [Pythium insidiosum]|nr:hypothetical protein ATCC90586_009472 [Pythium insidiosum]
MTKPTDALYASAEFVGYSLWLIPAGGPHEALHQLIVEYAARLMTPPFLPHITLLGGVTGLSEQEAIDKTRSVATMLHAMDLEVSVVASKELLYFQCVFGLIKEDDELASAHEAAKEGFARREEPDYMPHISLVYGDIEEEQRQALKRELGPRVDGMRLHISSLQLWNTSGPVKSWKMVTDVPLRSAR